MHLGKRKQGQDSRRCLIQHWPGNQPLPEDETDYGAVTGSCVFTSETSGGIKVVWGSESRLGGWTRFPSPSDQGLCLHVANFSHFSQTSVCEKSLFYVFFKNVFNLYLHAGECPIFKIYIMMFVTSSSLLSFALFTFRSLWTSAIC